MKIFRTLLCLLCLAKPHQTPISNGLLNVFVVGLNETEKGERTWNLFKCDYCHSMHSGADPKHHLEHGLIDKNE